MGVGLREAQKLLEALSAFCCGRVGKGQLVVGVQGWVEASSFLLSYPPWGSPHPGWGQRCKPRLRRGYPSLGLVLFCPPLPPPSPLGPLGLW